MSGPAPEDLGTHRALAANELDNLYYFGLRWMDRARKAETLNVDLLEALKAMCGDGEWITVEGKMRWCVSSAAMEKGGVAWTKAETDHA